MRRTEWCVIWVTFIRTQVLGELKLPEPTSQNISFYPLYVSVNTESRGGNVLFLSYLCLLLELASSSLAHTANTQGRNLTTVPLRKQYSSVSAASHFVCTPSFKVSIPLGIWCISSFFTHTNLHLKDDFGMTLQWYEAISKACTLCAVVLQYWIHWWRIPIYCGNIHRFSLFW